MCNTTTTIWNNFENPLFYLPEMILLMYILTAFIVLFSFFRTGINPNAPRHFDYSKTEMIAIFLMAIFWPITLIVLTIKWLIRR